MGVGRHLSFGRDRFHATNAAERVRAEPRTFAGRDGDPTAQVGQRKGDPTVPAVGGAEQSKQRGVLHDAEQLPVTGGYAREAARLIAVWLRSNG